MSKLEVTLNECQLRALGILPPAPPQPDPAPDPSRQADLLAQTLATCERLRAELESMRPSPPRLESDR